MPDDESGGLVLFYPAGCLPVNIMSQFKNRTAPFCVGHHSGRRGTGRCTHRYGGVALIIRGVNKSCHLFGAW